MYYFLIIIYLILMPVICWGPLGKSAQDPTTIADYIAAKILDHNVNPSAHGLDGYSIYNHRISPVLDHPIGSVLISRETFNEVVSRSSFESLDSWAVSDTAWVGVSHRDAVLLTAEFGVETPTWVNQSIDWPAFFSAWDKNWLLQFVAWSSYGTGVTFRGYITGAVEQNGFGFEFLNGDVRGFVKDDAVFTYTSYFTIDHTDIHTYRATYDRVDGKFHFWVDGVEKGSITKTVEVPGEKMNTRFELIANQNIGDEINVRVKSLITSIEL